MVSETYVLTRNPQMMARLEGNLELICDYIPNHVENCKPFLMNNYGLPWENLLITSKRTTVKIKYLKLTKPLTFLLLAKVLCTMGSMF